VLGWLDESERRAFEEHLAACADCRSELGQLEDAARLLAVAAPPYVVPTGLEGRTFVAVERAAASTPTARPTPRRRVRWTIAFAGVATIAAAVLALALRSGSPGEPELRAVLTGPVGQADASVEVRKTGIGRVIAFRSDSLPILPKGEYYELWFVGPNDSAARRNRISAGTFHPDEDGRSHVRFAAAVDPSLYPVIAVTAEPGDGDPRATGPEVLRSTR
jgi:anti-sigma-K factor RskA